MALEHDPIRSGSRGSPSLSQVDGRDGNYWYALIGEAEAADFLNLSVRSMQGYRYRGGGEGTVTMFIHGVCALPIGRIIIGAMHDNTEGALQEAFQQVMGNLIAQGIYNPERDTFTGTAHGAAVGITVGDIFSTLGSMIAGGGRRGRRDAGFEEARPTKRSLWARRRAPSGYQNRRRAPQRGRLGRKCLRVGQPPPTGIRTRSPTP